MVTVLIEGPLEVRLKRAATSAGAAPEALAERLLEEGLGDLPPAESSNPALALLDEWADEDATDDPAEIERRRAEVETLMCNLDRNRRESDGPNYRPLWPMGRM